MTPPTTRTPRRRWLFVQAPVPPLDIDGLMVSALGTVLFALATVAMLIWSEPLTAAGHGWWVGVGVAGTGLGLFGLAYCLHRRWRRRRGRWVRG